MARYEHHQAGGHRRQEEGEHPESGGWHTRSRFLFERKLHPDGQQGLSGTGDWLCPSASNITAACPNNFPQAVHQLGRWIHDGATGVKAHVAG